MRNEYMDQARLEQLSTGELGRLLHEEVRKERPDGELVRAVMGILKTRQKDQPYQCGANVDAAWQRYLARRTGSRKKLTRRSYQFLKVASVAAVLTLFFLAVPQTAEAAGLFDRIASWTDSFFELLNGDSGASDSGEYVFVTDNPGLQQVYDAVVELGITEPVVPMWLPEGYELTQCEVSEINSRPYLCAIFSEQDKRSVLRVDIYSQNEGSRYPKDASQVGIYEVNGISHSIMRNNGMWVAVWAVNDIEFFITIDCQETELFEVLDSIYSMEGK